MRVASGMSRQRQGSAAFRGQRFNLRDEMLACHLRLFPAGRDDDAAARQAARSPRVLSSGMPCAKPWSRWTSTSSITSPRRRLRPPGESPPSSFAASTPGLRERHDDIVIHDDAERGKVIVQFIEHVDERTRRVLKIYGFSGSGDVLEEAEVPTGARTWRSTSLSRVLEFSMCPRWCRSLLDIGPRRRR